MATTAATQSASLYVGSLHPEVTESILYDSFKEVGPILSIRVCRDAITRRSLGYAYVNFQNPPDAERAIDLLNFTPIRGKPVRIMWSQRDPALRNSAEGNIFIKGLDPKIDPRTLYDTFSSFGPILSVKIATDAEGKSRGYGYVHFRNPEDAKKAIDETNGTFLGDGTSPLAVKHFERNRRTAFTNLYFKNVDESVTLEQIKQLFGQFGDVKSAVLMEDTSARRTTETGKRFYGFVDLGNAEHALRAIEGLAGTVVNGRHIEVHRAMKKEERKKALMAEHSQRRAENFNKSSGCNLYVKHIDPTITDDKLLEIFRAHGVITSAKVVCTPQGVSRGFGYVCFASPQEAKDAIAALHGQFLKDNGSKPLFVALHQRREMRRAQMQAYHDMMMRAPSGIMPIPQTNPAFMYSGAPATMGYPPQFPGFMQQGGMAPSRGPRGGFRNNAMGNMPYGAAPGAPNANRPRRNNAPRGGAPAAPVMSAGPIVTPGAPVIATQPAFVLPAEVERMSAGDATQYIGNMLYEYISKVPISAGQDVGKLTGMLLEMDRNDLRSLIASSAALDAKIGEAINVLKAAM